MRVKLLSALLVCLLSLGAVPAAYATKIDPLLLEELVLQSECVALVECETAGGLAARFKVVEAFKGPKADARIVLAWQADFWGHHFPIALCGERYLVTAAKAAPSNLISTSSGGPVPLWWRRIAADYRLPFMQGKYLITPDDAESAKTLARAKELAALKPIQQEAALLQAIINSNVAWRGDKSDRPTALRKRTATLNTPDALVEELVRMAHEDPKVWGPVTAWILARGGMAQTLAVLEKQPKEKRPWAEEHFDNLCATIRTRLNKKDPLPLPERDELDHLRKAPTDDELLGLRTLLTDRGSRKWTEAFIRLTIHDPGTVAETLLKQEAGKESGNWRERGMRHGMASLFAHECGKDRVKHLTALLDAKDPWVRVAAAVYLCFENEAKGIEALKEMAKLDGAPGGWAALTLARRGHLDAVPRALELFPKTWPDDPDYNRCTPEENMQCHLLVLLSNSAQAGKAPQYRVAKGSRPTSASLQAWWQQNRGRVVLRDPWLDVLAKQKID